MQNKYTNKCIMIFLCIVLVLNLVGCKSEDYVYIETNFVISNLSDEDFQEIGTTNETNTKEDYKKLKLVLDMKHGKEITNRKVYVPSQDHFKELLNTYDNEEHYLFGNSTCIDNSSENLAYYEINIIMYTKNLDDNDIKNIFKSEEISISYLDKNHIQQTKIIKLSDLINIVSF